MATLVFKNKYGGLPGDLKNAQQFFSGTQNGNGNGRIEQDIVVPPNWLERFMIWQHLALAGLIPGSYDGHGGSTLIPNQNIPAISDDILFTVQYSNIAHPWMGPANQLRVGGSTTSGVSSGGAFTPSEALSIDQKIDDGKPRSGRISGENRSLAPGWSTECIDPDSAPLPYSVQIDKRECYIAGDF